MLVQEMQALLNIPFEVLAVVGLKVVGCVKRELAFGIRLAASRAVSAETMVSSDPAMTSVGTRTLRASRIGL